MVGVRKKRVFVSYINVVKDMYDRVVIIVRTTCGNTSEFLIVVGLHLELTLSLFLCLYISYR